MLDGNAGARGEHVETKRDSQLAGKRRLIIGTWKNRGMLSAEAATFSKAGLYRERRATETGKESRVFHLMLS